MGKLEIHRREFMKYTGIGLSGMAIPGFAMGCKKGLAGAASKSFHAIYEKVCNTIIIPATRNHAFPS